MSFREEENESQERREFVKGAVSGVTGAAAMFAMVSQLGVPVLNAAQNLETVAQVPDGITGATPKINGAAQGGGFTVAPDIPDMPSVVPTTTSSNTNPNYPPPWPKGTQGNKYSHLWSTKLKENTLVPSVIPSPQAYFRGDSDLPGAKINCGWQIFINPIRLEMESHHHDHDEYQFYLGATFPDLVGSFDAEIEVFLGPEYERHLITEACVLYLPAGFEHNPCDFRRVTKPVFFTSYDMAPFCHGVYQTMGWRAFRSSPKID